MSPDPSAGIVYLWIALFVACVWLSYIGHAIHFLKDSMLRKEAEEGNTEAEKLLSIAQDDERVEMVIHVARVIFSLADCALAILAFVGYLPDTISVQVKYVLVSLCQALALLLFCWMLPMGFASADPEKTVSHALIGIKVIQFIFYPITWLLSSIAHLILRLFGITSLNNEEVTEEQILQMVDMGEEMGAIETTEKEMIENIFEFNNRSAKDVMIHRMNMTAIWIGDEEKAIMQTLISSGYSRIPVYNENIDDIIGILNTRDYLLEANKKNKRPLRKLLREAYFVPETVQADVLFRDMQKRKCHMAIVVDEYGGVSGIITMEDLLEEIVGNIYDETDEQVTADIVSIGPSQWRVLGSTPLSEVQETIGIDLPKDDDIDTISGLVFSQFTTIPADGEKPQVDLNGLHIEVESIWQHRIESVIITLTSSSEDKAEE